MLTVDLRKDIFTRMKILIFGKGYVGSRCAEEWGEQAVITDKKIYSKEDALEVLDEVKPDVVLNAAGVRGKPNVDWCETHQHETVEGNIKLPINIAQACSKRGIYLLHVGSGCIFYGESPDPKGWKEDDFANPIAYYSKCKYAADLALGNLPNVGVARIRVPLDDRPYPGNIIDKLSAYPKIIDVANSLTVVPDMIETFYQILKKRAEGIFHVINPGALKYKDLMKLYKEMVDSNHTNEWITEEELVADGLVSKKRSTNKMQSTRLEKYDINMRPIEEAVRQAMENYAKRVKGSK